MAIDDSVHRLGREMRGTASIASAVTPAACSFSTSSGLRAGAMIEIRTAPRRSFAISLVGRRIDLDDDVGAQRLVCRTDPGTRVGEGRVRLVGMGAGAGFDDDPRKPSCFSWATVLAVAATRFSPSWIPGDADQHGVARPG